ncbi:hypothetical protein Mp_4g18650 [Marchantia polymorpha subsp. ruderalis]|uniref:Uncharacterized protein n=2 Tax=Marchantia polymorpha TaxID=3197 RepID=A0AAF6BBB8_MARPO|nr:hypothetical protein MARPO_0041s0147 [Marchantia polymorpha]BBN09302.1 hypothetical protein Mp_4g18650 [Marchantia polymorpha subsp. ruderalis]|eukprot:PTQ40293.1 hypothetical protein MARPO_0041s0147 [Marchantia polymorpha]
MSRFELLIVRVPPPASLQSPRGKILPERRAEQDRAIKSNCTKPPPEGKDRRQQEPERERRARGVERSDEDALRIAPTDPETTTRVESRKNSTPPDSRPDPSKWPHCRRIQVKSKGRRGSRRREEMEEWEEEEGRKEGMGGRRRSADRTAFGLLGTSSRSLCSCRRAWRADLHSRNSTLPLPLPLPGPPYDRSTIRSPMSRPASRAIARPRAREKDEEGRELAKPTDGCLGIAGAGAAATPRPWLRVSPGRHRASTFVECSARGLRPSKAGPPGHIRPAAGSVPQVVTRRRPRRARGRTDEPPASGGQSFGKVDDCRPPVRTAAGVVSWTTLELDRREDRSVVSYEGPTVASGLLLEGLFGSCELDWGRARRRRRGEFVTCTFGPSASLRWTSQIRALRPENWSCEERFWSSTRAPCGDLTRGVLDRFV